MATLLFGCLALVVCGAFGEPGDVPGTLPGMPQTETPRALSAQPMVDEQNASAQQVAVLQRVYRRLVDDKASLLSGFAPVLWSFAAGLAALYGNSTSAYAGQVVRLAAELKEVASSLSHPQQNLTRMQRFAHGAGAPNRSTNVPSCMASVANTVGTLGKVQYAKVQAQTDCAARGLSRDPNHCASDLFGVVEGLARAIGDMTHASAMCVHIGGRSLTTMMCGTAASYALQRLLTSVHESVVAHHWCHKQDGAHAAMACKKAVPEVIYNAAEATRWAHAASTHCGTMGQATGWQSQITSTVSAWSGKMMDRLGNATQALVEALASASTAGLPGAIHKWVRVVNASLGSLDADMRQVSLAGVSATSFVEQLKLYFARLPSAAAAVVNAAATIIKPSS